MLVFLERFARNTNKSLTSLFFKETKSDLLKVALFKEQLDRIAHTHKMRAFEQKCEEQKSEKAEKAKERIPNPVSNTERPGLLTKFKIRGVVIKIMH